MRLTFSKILLFEAGLGVLAVLLALLFGLKPWLDLHFGPSAWVLGLLATAPLALSLVLLAGTGWRWMKELEQFVRQALLPWLGKCNGWQLGLLALAAGVGEELLFRGVVQGGLAQWLGPWGALVLASLLFGLVHAMTRAYFLVATVAGFYLGLLYLWTGNLLVPIIVHFLYDWVALWWYMRGKGKPEQGIR